MVLHTCNMFILTSFDRSQSSRTSALVIRSSAAGEVRWTTQGYYLVVMDTFNCPESQSTMFTPPGRRGIMLDVSQLTHPVGLPAKLPLLRGVCRRKNLLEGGKNHCI